MRKFKTDDKWLKTAIRFAQENEGIFYSYMRFYQDDKERERVLKRCWKKEHPTCKIKTFDLGKILTNIRSASFKNNKPMAEQYFTKLREGQYKLKNEHMPKLLDLGSGLIKFAP